LIDRLLRCGKQCSQALSTGRIRSKANNIRIGTRNSPSSQPYELAGPATAHLFIVNPLRGRAALSWLSTTPPIEERVARLRSMSEHVDSPLVHQPG
jgi:Zn-dependent protease with chaperone function